MAQAARNADTYVYDIGVRDSDREASKAVLATYGVPDILISNAGFATYRTFAQELLADIERLVHRTRIE
jgi:short-subunit dehydrogenase